jgi:hypothetical protein
MMLFQATTTQTDLLASFFFISFILFALLINYYVKDYNFENILSKIMEWYKKTNIDVKNKFEDISSLFYYNKIHIDKSEIDSNIFLFDSFSNICNINLKEITSYNIFKKPSDPEFFFDIEFYYLYFLKFFKFSNIDQFLSIKNELLTILKIEHQQNIHLKYLKYKKKYLLLKN